MTNHRLRGAMLNAELTAPQLAGRVGVDPKSVTRWISEDRIPHPITRVRVAKVLEQQETFLWPALLESCDGDGGEHAGPGVERLWPTRSSIPTETWHALFSQATKQLDILVYAGGFLLETLDLADIISYKASTGTRIRILIGDPDSDAVKRRALEEQLPWLPDRCRTTGHYLVQVRCARGVSVRVHGTTLYASIYRFDNTMLVNQHAYGAWACQSPVHQISTAGGLREYYTAAFDRVWGTAEPAHASASAPGRSGQSVIHIDQVGDGRHDVRGWLAFGNGGFGEGSR